MGADQLHLLEPSSEYSEDVSKLEQRRLCAWCNGPIPGTMRSDAICCSQSHRQARWRFRRQIEKRERAEQPIALAYADPPYPGKANYYIGHPDYAGEVDHRELLQRLHASYDGWALSTSADALPEVLHDAYELELAVRVAAWFRDSRAHKSAWPTSAWEPVIYAGGRRVVSTDQPKDALQFVSRPRLTDPKHVIGAKPATFASWMFALLGARPGDSLDDLYPGSGGIARAWAIFNEQEEP